MSEQINTDEKQRWETVQEIVAKLLPLSPDDRVMILRTVYALFAGDFPDRT